MTRRRDDGSFRIEASCWKLSEVPVTRDNKAQGMQVVRGMYWEGEDEDAWGSIGEDFQSCPASVLARRLMLRACLQTRDPRNGKEAATLAATMPPSGEDDLHKLQHAEALLLAGRSVVDRKTARALLLEAERVSKGAAVSPPAARAKALRKLFDEVDLARCRGDGFTMKQNWDEALESYRWALVRATSCADTFARGEIHIKIAETCRHLSDERVHALQHADSAVELCPWNVRAWYVRGIARFDQASEGDSAESRSITANGILEDFERAGIAASLPNMTRQDITRQDLDTWTRRARAAVERGLPEKNYYKAMGLLCDCTDEGIKQKYKQLALAHHPDKVSPDDKAQATKRFQALQEAYEVLGNVHRRQIYDFGTTFGLDSD